MTEFTFPAKDNYPLSATLFKSASGKDSDKAVLISAAAGVNRKYYNRYAAYLSENNFHVVTYDYRGIGGSRPKNLRGFKASITDWGELDLPAAINYTITKFGSQNLFLIGHSIGGSLLGLCQESALAKGAINIAAQMAYYKDWAPSQRYKIYFFWHIFIPLLTRLYGYFPGKKWKLEDIPKGMVEQWHARRLVPSMEIQLRQAGFPVYYKDISFPILNLGFTDDPIGTEAALLRMAEVYANARIETRMINPAEIPIEKIGHFGFFKKEFRESLWKQSVEWLCKQ